MNDGTDQIVTMTRVGVRPIPYNIDQLIVEGSIWFIGTRLTLATMGGSEKDFITPKPKN